MNNRNLYRETQFTALQQTTRRHFLQGCTTGMGAMWMAMQQSAKAASQHYPTHDSQNPLSPVAPPLPAKAKRVIFLHMIGAPSQLELFDYKPDLKRLDGKHTPQSFLEGKRFAFIQGT
ncbi:secreted protein containing DUF1501, partial [Rhodopirellula maiorica SM1]